MGKQMIVFQPDHVINIITNSSSELFVFAGNTRENVVDMIKSVYPNFLDEYYELKCSSELTDDEIHTYLNYHYVNEDEYRNGMFASDYDPWQYEVIPGFEKDEISTEEIINNKKFRRLDDKKISKHRERLIKLMDPYGKKLFLFSKDDNPNYEMQKALEDIGGVRYHLG